MSKEYRYSAHDKEGEVTPDEQVDGVDNGFRSSYDEQDVFGAEEHHQVSKAIVHTVHCALSKALLLTSDI